MQSTLKNIAVQGNWPSQNDTPLSEFTTEYVFTFSFPCLFPYGAGDLHINRARTCTSTSMSDRAEQVQGWKICPKQILQIYCTQHNYERNIFRTAPIHHETMAANR